MKINNQSITKIALDLVIVFVGVLAAFWVNNYKENQINRSNQLKVYNNLRGEIDFLVKGGQFILPDAERQLANWNLAYENKEMPDPIFYRMPGLERPPNTIWQASLESDIVSLIDTDLMFELAVFYSTQESLFDQFDELKRLGLDRILPNEGNKAYFYNNDKTLKREFTEYHRMLEELIKIGYGLVEQGKALQTKFSKQIQKLN